MKMGRDELLAMLRMIDATADTELNCEQFLERVSAYLERLLVEGRSPDPEDAELVQHLQVCPECLEEFEALFAVLKAEQEST